MTHDVWYPKGREQTVDLDAVKAKAERDQTKGDNTSIHYHAYGTNCDNENHSFYFSNVGGSH